MPKSQLEEQLYDQFLGSFDIPAPVREHRFHPVRRWRFDFAWVGPKLAVEVQGGIWSGGAHGRGVGITRDMEKLNEAQILGWSVLFVSSEMIKDGRALEWVKTMLEKRRDGGD